MSFVGVATLVCLFIFILVRCLISLGYVVDMDTCYRDTVKKMNKDLEEEEFEVPPT